MDLFNFAILNQANGLARHSEARLDLISRNVANADTPGYRGRDLAPFTTDLGGLEMRATRPGHMQDDAGLSGARTVGLDTLEAPNGNNVSLEDQMQRASDVRLNHELASGVYKSAMRLMRGGIGK